MGEGEIPSCDLKKGFIWLSGGAWIQIVAIIGFWVVINGGRYGFMFSR